MKTAAALGLASCHLCRSLTPLAEGHCRRCGEPLHLRKADSWMRSAALLLAAVIFFIPANLMPVMTVVMAGREAGSTILEGVLLLWHEGMWPLALLIFVASVVVPGLKMVILTGLLWSVRHGGDWSPLDRTRFYRLTAFIGRWSMVDIFVVAILVALVVVLTALAAEAFDQRLIWDAEPNPEEFEYHE